jgi:hypothetical protein
MNSDQEPPAPRQLPPPPGPPTAVILQNPGAVAMAGQVASDTVGALKGQPVLLLIVVLNIAMMLAGGLVGWAVIDKTTHYLEAQETWRHDERKGILELLLKCTPTAAPEHSKASTDAVDMKSAEGR